MALVLGEEDAIWIESAQEASKQYDHYELAAFRYYARKKPIPSQTGRSHYGNVQSSSFVDREASCSNQVGGCPDLASSIGESPNAGQLAWLFIHLELFKRWGQRRYPAAWVVRCRLHPSTGNMTLKLSEAQRFYKDILSSLSYLMVLFFSFLQEGM